MAAPREECVLGSVDSPIQPWPHVYTRLRAHLVPVLIDDLDMLGSAKGHPIGERAMNDVLQELPIRPDSILLGAAEKLCTELLPTNVPMHSRGDDLESVIEIIMSQSCNHQRNSEYA